MRDWQGKKYWVVGASEGLGRSLTEVMSRAGAHLVISARNSDRLAELAATLPGQVTQAPCDVRDDESVAAAAEIAGEVDGIVYLAGVYTPLKAQDWDPAEVTAMCDVNLTGAARVLGHVVPGMIARDTGHIVLTGSLAGFRGLPGSVGYGASKAGIMVLAESLYADLRKTNIDVQVVNPGFIKTRLTEKNNFKMPMIMEPDAAAREFFEHMNDDAFSKSYPLAFGAMFRLSQLLPDWLYYRVFA